MCTFTLCNEILGYLQKHLALIVLKRRDKMFNMWYPGVCLFSIGNDNPNASAILCRDQLVQLPIKGCN